MDIKKVSLLVKDEEIRIPQELIKGFGNELRIVIDHQTGGIALAEGLAPEMLKGLFKDFDIILTPKKLRK
ncbi:MAG: hypothetical protein J5U17_06565 [Candidatus Methanoperedens sp.]|nr:hypothetical protein [Candidatus Methanoperedens sp.]MCE8427841.1 hypothetical protein [Candidatus Methanoperedens sp.]